MKPAENWLSKPFDTISDCTIPDIYSIVKSISRRYEILNQKLCNNSEGGLGDAEVASDLLRGDLDRLVDEVQDGGIRIHSFSIQGLDVVEGSFWSYVLSNLTVLDFWKFIFYLYSKVFLLWTLYGPRPRAMLYGLGQILEVLGLDFFS